MYPESPAGSGFYYFTYMPKKLYKNRHYNIPGHAHELTFSCYRRKPLFEDTEACQLFLKELGRSRDIYEFKLWAYVVMPHHVHLLLWPLRSDYDIGKIMSGIKGIMSKRYRKYLLETNRVLHDSLLLKINKQEKFVFWQKGGGFDRNLWNAKAIHDSVRYIEANPVRSRFVSSPGKWKWSSAYARAHKKGMLPDRLALPVALANPQSQKVAVV